MAERLDVQDFPTPAGIVRRGTNKQGALYEAILYAGSFTTQEVIGEILRILKLQQTMRDEREQAKAADRAAWEKHGAASRRLIAALDQSSVEGPGKAGDIDRIEQVYTADPDVMDAAKEYRAAGEEHEKASAFLAEVRARPVPKINHCWADENGPVEVVGTRHAIGMDGTTYTLGKGGIWNKDKGSH